MGESGAELLQLCLAEVHQAAKRHLHIDGLHPNLQVAINGAMKGQQNGHGVSTQGQPGLGLARPSQGDGKQCCLSWQQVSTCAGLPNTIYIMQPRLTAAMLACTTLLPAGTFMVMEPRRHFVCLRGVAGLAGRQCSALGRGGRQVSLWGCDPAIRRV